MSDKKFSREELAAELEAKAKALRENVISDEEIEKMSAAGCAECCGGCQVNAPTCYKDYSVDKDCVNTCVQSSPN